MKKKAIILQHNGDELGSQLWNYASIYAYCVDRRIDCINYSFFEFAEFYPHLTPKNLVVKFLFFIPFTHFKGRKYSLYTRFFRFIYRVYVNIMRLLHKKSHIRLGQHVKYKTYNLPPTNESREINRLEKKNSIYLDGHLFRNHAGMKKYRKEIVSHFTPSKKVQQEVANRLSKMHSDYVTVVGVHIRQSDYRTFKRGRFFVDVGHMRTFIDEFIEKFKIDTQKTVFYITSDSPVENSYFEGLNFVIESDNPAIELYTLSGTDIILGSDSHFGSFASYYGNIPHIVCHRTEIDWDYYMDKHEFFPNKYWIIAKP